jgi:branched-subunit amino acid aminotransferase/4-amino-4-deoxychorismate lyase
VWMTAGPLPSPLPGQGAVINRCIIVDHNDPLARHKTLNYWRNRLAHESAILEGDDEVLTVTADNTICEASRSNVFLVDGPRLQTQSSSGPLLAGIMRLVVMEQAERLGLVVDEHPLPLDAIRTSREAFLTNSVRGIIPISRILDQELPAPGPVTRRLWSATLTWLESGGINS